MSKVGDEAMWPDDMLYVCIETSEDGKLSYWVPKMPEKENDDSAGD